MIYVVKCLWRATSLKLVIVAASAAEALDKAQTHHIGRKALSHEIYACRDR